MTARHFALIPAAGHSTRMRAPKLLLPLAGRPLICHTIDAWQQSKVDRIVIVVRPGDESLADAVRASGVEIVIPDRPPADMKSSVQAAIAHLEQKYDPLPHDAFLVAPADMPQLSPRIIDRLIARHATDSTGQILVPTLNGRRGHPVLFNWRFSQEVYALGPAEGLDTIVHRHPPVTVACEDLVAANEYPFADIDTPDDLKQMTND